MEEKKLERDLMTDEEFSKYIEENRSLRVFDAVRKYKSVTRAMKRGCVTDLGVIAPRRPFHNRANTSKRRGVHSRAHNELKKRIYDYYKRQNL